MSQKTYGIAALAHIITDIEAYYASEESVHKNSKELISTIKDFRKMLGGLNDRAWVALKSDRASKRAEGKAGAVDLLMKKAANLEVDKDPIFLEIIEKKDFSTAGTFLKNVRLDRRTQKELAAAEKKAAKAEKKTDKIVKAEKKPKRVRSPRVETPVDTDEVNNSIFDEIELMEAAASSEDMKIEM